MPTITHAHARRGLAAAVAAAAALAVAPSTALAQQIPVGQAAVAGTVAYADGPDCAAETFHENALAAGAVVDPAGTYAGTLSISADATSWCFGLSVDTGTITVSVSGGDAGHSMVCRDAASPAGAPAPMPGIFQRIGTILTLAADGICNIDGSDSVHEHVWQTLVLVPTGVSVAAERFTGGAVSGDLEIGF